MTAANPLRLAAQANAAARGYFWLPYPLCGQHFGGQEWDDVDGHHASIPDPERNQAPDGALPGTAICLGCTAAGAGCRAWHAIGVQVHLDCPALAEAAGGVS